MFTYPNPAQRIDAVLAQNAPLDRVCDLLADYRAADLRHARTQSEADYLEAIRLQDAVLEVIGDAFGIQMDEQRGWLAMQMERAA
jgi:hypothetical protein